MTLRWGFPGDSDGEEPACNAGDLDSIPGLGRSPREGNGYPTPEFLPGKFHGQRSLADFCPWGLKGVGHNLAAKQQHSVKWECTVYYTTMWKHITISLSNRPLKDFYIFVFEKL